MNEFVVFMKSLDFFFWSVVSLEKMIVMFIGWRESIFRFFELLIDLFLFLKILL